MRHSMAIYWMNEHMKKCLIMLAHHLFVYSLSKNLVMSGKCSDVHISSNPPVFLQGGIWPHREVGFYDPVVSEKRWPQAQTCKSLHSFVFSGLCNHVSCLSGHLAPWTHLLLKSMAVMFSRLNLGTMVILFPLRPISAFTGGAGPSSVHYILHLDLCWGS